MSGTSDNLLWMQSPELANALRRRQMGEALLREGGDSSPIKSPWQGVNRLAQALIGGYEMRKSDDAVKDYTAKSDKEMADFGALVGGGAAPQAPMAPQPGQPRAMPTAPGAAPPSDLVGMVAPVAQKYGVPLNLALALIQQESSGNPGAVGDGGQSVGLGQIQARTAQQPGYGVPPMDPARRTDPAANIDFAMNYLASKGRALGATDLANPEHQAIALRAYNGGGDPNYVQNVRGRMGGETVQTAGPGAPPDPGSRDLSEAQRLMGIAQQAAQSRNPQIRAQAPILMQQAQMAQQAALARQPGEMVVTPDPSSPSGYKYVPRQQAGGMPAPEPRPMVSITNSGESAFEKDRAGTMAKRVGEWEDANVKSAQTMTRLGQMEKALDQFTTGAGSGTILKAGQIAQRMGVPQATLDALGINADQVASGEQIRSLASQMLVGMIGSGGFPAQGFSNADRDMLERALPGLANSPQGNKMIIGIMRASAQRDMEIGKAWRDWSRVKGDNLASVRGFQSEILPGIVERGIVAPILEQGGWTDPTAGPAASAPPAPGAVIDGHRFRGGDPANPASWEPAQ